MDLLLLKRVGLHSLVSVLRCDSQISSRVIPPTFSFVSFVGQFDLCDRLS